MKRRYFLSLLPVLASVPLLSRFTASRQIPTRLSDNLVAYWKLGETSSLRFGMPHQTSYGNYVKYTHNDKRIRVYESGQEVSPDPAGFYRVSARYE